LERKGKEEKGTWKRREKSMEEPKERIRKRSKNRGEVRKEGNASKEGRG
jgi:hypothetical protein